MKTIKLSTRLIAEERETILNYNSIDKMWTMDSMVPKQFRKALKQGWTPLVEYVYEDGTVCGMVLTAPEKAITIRNPNKVRVMSERQMNNLHGHKDDEDEDGE